MFAVLSPEGNPSSFRRLMTTASLALVISIPIADVSPKTFGYITGEQVNPNQLAGIFAYGHREPEAMLATGNIADGFSPIDGKEYGEKDVELMYQKLRQWKEAGLDFVVFSWESYTQNNPNKKDWRDDFFNWFLNDVMKQCNNPFPELKVTAIHELDSIENTIPQTKKDQNIEYFQKRYFPSPHFLKDKLGRSVIFWFAQEIEGIYNNPGYLEGLSETAEKYGIFIIAEDYFLSNFNPHHEDPNIGFFNYANNILQIASPKRTDETEDVFVVRNSYAKDGDPLKTLPYNGQEFGDAIDRGMRSEASYLTIVSDGEAIEHSGITSESVRILNEKLMKRQAERMSLIDSRGTCVIPPKENVVYMNRAARREIPPKERTA